MSPANAEREKKKRDRVALLGLPVEMSEICLCQDVLKILACPILEACIVAMASGIK